MDSSLGSRSSHTPPRHNVARHPPSSASQSLDLGSDDSRQDADAADSERSTTTGTTTATTTTTTTTATTTATTEVTRTDIHGLVSTTTAAHAAPQPLPFSNPQASGLPALPAHLKAIQQPDLDGPQRMLDAIRSDSPKEVQAVLLQFGLLNKRLEDGTTPLHMAVSENKNKVVSFLLKHPLIDVNKANNQGWTALYQASSDGNSTSLALLLKHPKIDVTCTTPLGMTAYHVAIQNGHTDVAQMLLDKGADATQKTKEGLGALHLACQSAALSTVQWLLLKQVPYPQTQGTPPSLLTVLNHVSSEGWTPYLLAVQSGELDLVRFFLKNPLVDKTAVNHNGDGALHLSIKTGQVPIVDLLIERGDDITAANAEGFTPLLLALLFAKQHAASQLPQRLLPLLLDKGAHVNQATKDGRRPLHIACAAGDVNTVKWLLDSRAFLQGKYKRLKQVTVINQRTADGKTPLRMAVEAKSDVLVRLLMALGARADRADKQGDTPLHAAARDLRALLVATELLSHKGWDVNMVNLKRETPLAVAISNQNIDMQELLVDAGADVHHADTRGANMLHLACQKHQLKLVQRLLQSPQLRLLHGKPRAMAEVLNQPDNRGNTLLLSAIGEGTYAPAMVAFLVAQPGIDLNQANEDGHTPLHRACSLGLIDIARLLVGKGANAGYTDTRGATPLHLAARSNRVEIVKLLLKIAGLPLKARTSAGETALQMAIRVGADDVAELLMQYDDGQ